MIKSTMIIGKWVHGVERPHVRRTGSDCHEKPGDEDRQLIFQIQFSNLEYKELGLEGLIVIFKYMASVQLHQNYL